MERKGWGEICHTNTNQKKTHIVILHKVDLKAKSIGNKEGYFIKIQESEQQENQIALNLYSFYDKNLKIYQLKGEKDKSVIKSEDFSIFQELTEQADKNIQ